jgi:hypothetical protein
VIAAVRRGVPDGTGTGGGSGGAGRHQIAEDVEADRMRQRVEDSGIGKAGTTLRHDNSLDLKDFFRS